MELVVVQGHLVGGYGDKESGAANAGTEVVRGDEMVATDNEGETLTHLEECLGQVEGGGGERDRTVSEEEERRGGKGWGKWRGDYWKGR